MTRVLSVLVVDDERILADTMVVILNNAGYNASAAYSGNGAVEAAKRLQPDYIVSDINMPHMNGVEAMILVRGFLPKCKIFLFSGSFSAAALLENARDRGHYLSFNPSPSSLGI